MSNDLLFGLAIFLGGIWYVALDRIISMGSNNPADESLVLLALVHFVVFAYVVLALIAFYLRGLATLVPTPSSEAQPTQPPSPVEVLLLATWPAAASALVLVFIVSRLSGISPEWTDKIFTILLAALFYLTLRRLAKKYPDTLRQAHIIRFGICLALGFVVYMMVLSLLFGGVSVTTNKATYTPGDTAEVTVKTTGYIFLPYVEEIDILGAQYTASHIHSSTVSITLQLPDRPELADPVQWGSPHYGRVVYRLQILPFAGKGYFPIRFAPKPAAT